MPSARFSFARARTARTRTAMPDTPSASAISFTMQELEGRSVKEIAEALGVSGIAVRVRAVRARAKLKRALENLAAKNL